MQLTGPAFRRSGSNVHQPARQRILAFGGAEAHYVGAALTDQRVNCRKCRCGKRFISQKMNCVTTVVTVMTDKTS
jgi:hypothetical protein